MNFLVIIINFSKVIISVIQGDYLCKQLIIIIKYRLYYTWKSTCVFGFPMSISMAIRGKPNIHTWISCIIKSLFYNYDKSRQTLFVNILLLCLLFLDQSSIYIAYNISKLSVWYNLSYDVKISNPSPFSKFLYHFLNFYQKNRKFPLLFSVVLARTAEKSGRNLGFSGV